MHGRVEVELSFFPLMWILYLVSPWISINGNAQRKSWGKHPLELPAGQYQIEAWFPYLFKAQCCKASYLLNVVPGGTYKLRYRPAWLMFLPGTLKLVEQPQLPAATALP